MELVALSQSDKFEPYVLLPEAMLNAIDPNTSRSDDTNTSFAAVMYPDWFVVDVPKRLYATDE